MSAFDDIQERTFASVQNTFGDVASWSSNGSIITGNVLFSANDPKYAVDTGIFFDEAQWIIEYYMGTFPGLYEAINGGSTENISLNGKNLVVLNNAAKKSWDGKTIKLYCLEK